jgi:hypothetical protein
MAFYNAFFGSDQSFYTAYAIMSAIIAICITILLTATDISIGNRILIVLFVIVTLIPSIFLTLFQITCIVTGGTEPNRWWCYAYAWILAAFVIIYCVFVVIISLISLFTYNNAMDNVNKAKKMSKLSDTKQTIHSEENNFNYHDENFENYNEEFAGNWGARKQQEEAAAARRRAQIEAEKVEEENRKRRARLYAESLERHAWVQAQLANQKPATTATATATATRTPAIANKQVEIRASHETVARRAEAAAARALQPSAQEAAREKERAEAHAARARALEAAAALKKYQSHNPPAAARTGLTTYGINAARGPAPAVGSRTTTRNWK